MHVKMKFKFFSCFGHTFSLLHTWPPTVVQNQFFGPSFCKIYFTAKSYLAGLSFFLQSHGYQYEVPLITQLWQNIECIIQFDKIVIWKALVWGFFPCIFWYVQSWWKTLTRYRSVEKILQISASYIDSDMINLFFKIPPDWSVWLMVQLHVSPSHNPQNHAFSFLTYIQCRSSQ